MVTRLRQDDGTYIDAEDTVAVKKATVTLTNAQIKACPGTGVEVLPAPGTGKRYYLLGVELESDFTAGAYTNIDVSGCNMYLVADPEGYFNPCSLQAGDSSTRAFFGNANAQGGWLGDFVMTGFIGYVGFPASSIRNKPIYFWIDNPSGGDYTGGHEDNTLAVTVLYTVIDV